MAWARRGWRTKAAPTGLGTMLAASPAFSCTIGGRPAPPSDASRGAHSVKPFGPREFLLIDGRAGHLVDDVDHPAAATADRDQFAGAAPADEQARIRHETSSRGGDADGGVGGARSCAG